MSLITDLWVETRFCTRRTVVRVFDEKEVLQRVVLRTFDEEEAFAIATGGRGGKKERREPWPNRGIAETELGVICPVRGGVVRPPLVNRVCPIGLGRGVYVA